MSHCSIAYEEGLCCLEALEVDDITFRVGKSSRPLLSLPISSCPFLSPPVPSRETVGKGGRASELSTLSRSSLRLFVRRVRWRPRRASV